MASNASHARPGRVKNVYLVLLAALVVAGAVFLSFHNGQGESDADDPYVQKITTQEQFNDVVLKADKPVLVDFFATWCGPCRRLAPIIHELAKEYEGRVVFVKVDVDKARDLAAKNKVPSIPDVRIFHGGKEIKKIVGLNGPEVYRSILDSALAEDTGKEKEK